ncbi:MAG: class I SAM-dependent methyltransferase [Pseudomonadota bacterium]
MTDPDPVAAQYEAYPYPSRDPEDERRRLVTGSPSHLDEVNHYVFGGRRDFRAPFRALIAGGGTGDATIMLAQQLTDRGAPAEVVYLDRSTAARRVAEARATARGLANLRFVTASLLDLPALGLGAFDYIDCCGVLHHLPDPGAGLAVLARSLAAGGGLGVMVYGEYGRTGIYPAQEMLRMIAGPELPPAERLAVARRLVDGLPAGNWLKRNPIMAEARTGDAALFDLLLNAVDRAYRVEEVGALAARAGLRIAAFVPPALYEPETWIEDPVVRARLAGLDAPSRAAFAEQASGAIKVHIFYAVAADNPVAPPAADDPAAVPRWCEPVAGNPDAPARGRPTLAVELGGATRRFELPPLGPTIIGRIDGQATLAALHRGLAAGPAPGLSWPGFLDAFRATYGPLHGLGKLMLALPPA